MTNACVKFWTFKSLLIFLSINLGGGAFVFCFSRLYTQDAITNFLTCSDKKSFNSWRNYVQCLKSRIRSGIIQGTRNQTKIFSSTTNNVTKFDTSQQPFPNLEALTLKSETDKNKFLSVLRNFYLGCSVPFLMSVGGFD